MSSTFLTIGIIAFRSRKQVAKVVESLTQTSTCSTKFEILIIRDINREKYDFQVDFSQASIRELSHEYQGIAEARNWAIENADPKTTIFGFIDDDAIALGDIVSNVFCYFSQNPNSLLVAGQVVSQSPQTIAGAFSRLFPAHDPMKYRLPIGANFFSRIQAIKTTRFDARFKNGYDDFDFGMRALETGIVTQLSHDIQVVHPDPKDLLTLIKKKFNSSRYFILFCNKYRMNPFSTDDIFCLLLLLAILTLSPYLLSIALIALAFIFVQHSSNSSFSIPIKGRLFLVFIFIRFARLAGKVSGICEWGIRTASRS